MTFETNRDVLDWYEEQPRTLDENLSAIIDKNVTQRIQGLFGLNGVTKVSDKIGSIVARHNPAI